MQYFKSSKSLKKNNINVYHFVLSENVDSELNKIKKILDIKSIPSSFIENTNAYRILHTNNFELHTSNLANNNGETNQRELFNIYGEVGVRMSTNYIDKKICVYLTSENTNELKNQVVSYILGYFKFKNLNTTIQDSLTPETPIATSYPSNASTTYFYHPNIKFRKAIRDAIYTAVVQNEVREFVTLPANRLTSTTYVRRMRHNLKQDVNVKNITFTVLGERELRQEGLNLLLSVNNGSSNDAQLVILEYRCEANEDDESICLVGKGLMFDTGGYNIKLGDFSDMNTDMAGAAVIYGVFKLLSYFKVKGRFVALLPLVENKINQFATLPGDVVTAHNKKTVEIINTDAEGRLILADALSYTNKYNPKLCIDVATLTGSAVSTFGGLFTAVIGNAHASAEIKKLIDLSVLHHENMWELPLTNEYIRLTTSNVADYRNLSLEASAGAIMGAAFLSHFIPEGVKWVHLDIAGVASLKGATNTRQYGGTGETMRTLLSFLLHASKKV